jgi:hypothetical protein
VRRRGATLIEVLVAVVVCGSGLAVAATGISAALRAETHADDLSRATACLDLLLARVEGKVLPLETAKGDFAADGEPDLAWDLTVEPGEKEGLMDARLVVRWTRHDAERELAITRLIFVDPKAGTQ